TPELARDLRWVLLALIGSYSRVYAVNQGIKSRDSVRALRFLAMCATAFCVLFGYAIARPATESLFMESYGVENEPFVWIVSPLVGVGIVGAYNRYAARASLARSMATVCGLSMLVLTTILGARGAGVPGATFFLYVWKDFYIVFLVEIFWIYANAVYPARSARWAYGAFLGWGAAGGYVGNLSVGPYAKAIGTANALWLVIPTLLGAALVFAWATRDFVVNRPDAGEAVPFVDGFRRVVRNKTLTVILALVGLSQLAVTLIDFRWKLEIQNTIADTASRTDAAGMIYGAISIMELALQLVAGPILKLVGSSGVLLAVPFLLTVGMATLVGAPNATLLSSLKVASKGFDYSIFRIAKEMLYIPLSYADKSRGKPVIDILGYRAAKGAISLLLIIPWLQSTGWVDVLTIGALLLWSAVTVFALQKRHVGTNPTAKDAKPA
ncbi:MAG: Npt1/Npt2 family nucleotide transporter, partial [Myxococcota bacterium]